MRPINSAWNPTPKEIADLVMANRLAEVLRGEVAVYITPETINGDMRPTDHLELLSKGIYPLILQLGVDGVRERLEDALVAICTDGLGVHCAHQCYYMQISKEDAGESPIALDRTRLPAILGQAFVQHEAELHRLEIKPGDAGLDSSYGIVLSGMHLLAQNHGIDWGIPLPPLTIHHS